jgi:uncharacterized OB-fold protein
MPNAKQLYDVCNANDYRRGKVKLFGLKCKCGNVKKYDYAKCQECSIKDAKKRAISMRGKRATVFDIDKYI